MRITSYSYWMPVDKKFWSNLQRHGISLKLKFVLILFMFFSIARDREREGEEDVAMMIKLSHSRIWLRSIDDFHFKHFWAASSLSLSLSL